MMRPSMYGIYRRGSEAIIRESTGEGKARKGTMAQELRKGRNDG